MNWSHRTLLCPGTALLALAIWVSGATAAANTSKPVFHPLSNASGIGKLPFSESVSAAGMLYLSGQIGTDAAGKLVTGGIRAEARQAMDNIGSVLARRGASFDDVVQCTVALAEIKDWPAFNEVYRSYFKSHFPARMAYAASGLALGARVEVQCNAATPH